MTKTFADSDISARVRDAMEKIARNVVREEGVTYKYGTVTAIDYDNSVVQVQFPGSGISVPVRVLGIQPTQTGQVVQVASRKKDHFVNGVVGASGIVSTGGSGLAAPTLTLKGYTEAIVGDWNAVAGAVAYEFQVSEQSDFTGQVFNYQTAATQYTFPTDEFGTGFYARVRALDGSTPPQAGGWSNTAGPISPTDAGVSSDGVAPADSPDVSLVVGIGYLQAKWDEDNTNADPVAYEVHISTSSGFAPDVTTFYDATGGNTLFIRSEPDGTPLQYDTNYYVRLVAFDIDGKALNAGAQAVAQIARVETADAGNIGIDNVSDGVVPSTSPDVKTVTGGVGYLFVTWDHVSNVDPPKYEIHVSTTTGFSPNANTKVGDTPSNFFFIREQGPGALSAPLEQATTYYVKIIAYDADGYAPSFGAQGSGALVKAVNADIGNLAIKEAQLDDAAVTTAKILDGAVQTLKIADGAVQEAKIAANAVTETKITDNAVTTPKIIAGAVKAAQIDAGAVVAGKIAAGAVTAGTIDALAVTAGTIAADAVTATEILAGTITASEIATSTITANEMVAGTITAASGIIADAAIETAKIANAAITTALIADAQISSAKIQDLAVTDAKINTLTASKITAGTITGEEIILNGSLSKLRSSNYVAGSAGWQIDGNGIVEFDSGTFRGTIVAQSGSVTGNLTVQSNLIIDGSPDMYLGNNVYNGSGTWAGLNFDIGQTGTVDNFWARKSDGRLLFRVGEMSSGGPWISYDTSTTIGLAMSDAAIDTILYWAVPAGGLLHRSYSDNNSHWRTQIYAGGAWRNRLILLNDGGMGVYDNGGNLKHNFQNDGDYSNTGNIDLSGNLLMNSNTNIDTGLCIIKFERSGTTDTLTLGANDFVEVARNDDTNHCIQFRPNEVVAAAPFDGGGQLGKSGQAWGHIYTWGFTNYSSNVMKENIVESDLGLDFINDLKPVKFTFKNGTSGRPHYGLIAQDVEALIQQMGIDFGGFDDGNYKWGGTHGERDGWEDGPPDPEALKGLRYNEFIGPIIKALQEISARLDAAGI